MNNELKYSARNFYFYFGDAYETLRERGELTDEQLERVTNLLDKMEDYPPDLFEERLLKIFGEEKPAE